MFIHNIFTLPRITKLQKINASALIESMAAVMLISVTLTSLMRLNFITKHQEKHLGNKLKKYLSNTPLQGPTCQEVKNYGGVTLSKCTKRDVTKYYISGFSTLEIILSLVILLPALFSLSSTLNTSFRQLASESNRKHEIHSEVKLNSLFNKMSKEIDKHPFQIYPRTHKAGQIRFVGGKMNPVNKVQSNLRPQVNSGAITYLSLNVLDTFEILSHTGNSLYACPRYGSSYNIANKSSLLFLGPQVYAEAYITKLLNKGNNCLEITYSLPISMLFTKPVNVRGARQIIPIESIYTLYMDRKNTLRYLGHRNGLNIENQPVLDKSPVLNYKSQVIDGFFSVKAVMTWKNKTSEIIAANKLKRGSLLNFTLNSP